MLLLSLLAACTASSDDTTAADTTDTLTPRDDGAPPISHWSDEGLAVDGYDTVAYFTDSDATLGDPAIITEWGGAEWRFASDSNRELFLADPTAYAPAYGSYCAYAMADDRFATTDATAWDVVDGRLFLNYSAEVREKWLKAQAAYIVAADENWAAKISE
ncbi:MAG: hypothetical protein ACI8RZ_000098 [Myxococcota bacterium]|jgi:hypothetical protein